VTPLCLFLSVQVFVCELCIRPVTPAVPAALSLDWAAVLHLLHWPALYACNQSEIQQMRDLLSSRMPLQQVARFCKEDLQALNLCVRDDVTLKTASRNMLENAMSGKHALVDAIVIAFQGDHLYLLVCC